MTQQFIDIGIQGNDGTGDSIRTSFDKVNKNFTELYAIFGSGGTIKFTDLGDAPSSYTASQIIMSSKTGVGLTARDVVAGAGIIIDKNDDQSLTIAASIAGIVNDNHPTLSHALNAAGNTIGNLASPSEELVTAFNLLYPSTTTTLADLAVPKGYVDENYVGATVKTASNGLITAYEITAPLKPRAEPTLPQTSSEGYDPTLTGNYLSTEAMQRKDVVYRGGDTMSGALVLNDHPGGLAGAGSPNGSDDLQAATKFYVDANTYYSGVNLYVSTTKGNDLQSNTPPGREGRAWQYAYKTVSAAALAAETLINLSQVEPGPYKQAITWSTTTDQFPSVVQSVNLSNGTQGITGYADAAALLEANKAFIQAETIAYLNKKYVNEFTLDKARYTSIIQDILNGIGYDLVLETNYNSITNAARLFDARNSDLIGEQLTQLIDGINYAKTQVLNYSYSSPALKTYAGTVIDAIGYDIAFGSNYQSIQAALAFSELSTTINATELADLLDTSTLTVTAASGDGDYVTLTFATQVDVPYAVGEPIIVTGIQPGGFNGHYTVSDVTDHSVSYANVATASTDLSNAKIRKGNLVNNILAVSQVGQVPTAVTSVTNNAALISQIALTGEIPTPVFPDIPTTIPGQTSAAELLLNNVEFIKAEIAGWLRVHFPSVVFNTTKSKRDIEYIVWSICYDLMYGGNSQSVYAGLQYWEGGILNLTESEKAAWAGAISYINTLAQAIITNVPPATLYQQTYSQYTNSTLNGNVVATGTVVSGDVSSHTLTVDAGNVPIYVGQVITGTGFTGAQTVVATTIVGDNTVITLSAVPNASPSGVLTFTSPVIGSISSNIASIVSIVNSVSLPTPAVVTPTTTNASSSLQAARTAITSSGPYATLKTAADTYIQHAKFSIISNSTVTNTINGLFTIITDMLTYGPARMYAKGTVIGGSTLSTELIVNVTSGDIAVGQRVYGTGFNGQRVTAVHAVGTTHYITLNTVPGDTPSGVLSFIYAATFPSSGIDASILAATQGLMANLDFVSQETAAWMQAIPGAVFDTASATHDFRAIIQAVVYDIAYGADTNDSNSASIKEGIQYWLPGATRLPTNPTSLNIYYQGLTHALTLSTLVSQDSEVTPVFQTNVSQIRNAAWGIGGAISGVIADTFTIIADIAENNNASSYATIWPSLDNGTSDNLAARIIITYNLSTISNDVNTYLGNTYTGNFKYNQATCYRDLGYIIDGSIIDLLTGGNYQSINAGKAYYRNASAKAIAIGSQYTETVDGIAFAKELALQVLNQTSAVRYQSIISQTNIDGTKTPSALAISTFTTNYNYILDIIQYGYGIAPTPSFGNGIYTITMSNGSTGYVDQGKPGNVHIIPAKILVGSISNAYGQIVSYAPGGGSVNVDTIVVRMTRPGAFIFLQTTGTGNAGEKTVVVDSATGLQVGLGVTGSGIGLGAVVTAVNGTTITLSVANIGTVSGTLSFGEQLQYGETVSNLQITMHVESGIYYEDLPIKLPQNVTLRGDDFRRTIIRPLDRISQSPWAGTFFYRDGVIDNLQQNPINYSVDYANSVSLTIGSRTGSITATLSSGQAPQSWIGLILTDGTNDSTVSGKAVVNSVNGNTLLCTVMHPFSAAEVTPNVLSAGQWHLYATSNYGRHYLTNPLDYTSAPKNNKDIDMFMVNDANHLTQVSFQGHGGFAVVLDPTGQIKTKSPFVQSCASFSSSIAVQRFAGGVFVDGFTGRLYGTITDIETVGINNVTQLTVVGSANSGLDIRPPQVPCSFYVQGQRYQVDDIVSYDSSTSTVILTLDTATPFSITSAYDSGAMTTNMNAALSAMAYDMALGTNFKSVQMGVFYLQSQNAVVGLGQTVVVQAISRLNTATTGYALDTYGHASIAASATTINNIIVNGTVSIPTITFTPPTGASAGVTHAAEILQDPTNHAFIEQEIIAWIAANYSLSSINGYNSLYMQRDIKQVIDTVTYDILYGGNSATYDNALNYWANGASTLTQPGRLAYGTQAVYIAAYGRLNTVLQKVIANDNYSWTKSAGNNLTQNITVAAAATSTEIANVDTLMLALVDYIADGNFTTTSTTRSVPSIAGQASNIIADFNLISSTNRTAIITNVNNYLLTGAGISINLEMAGNRSILGDNFTQVNDMGYGIVATNGGTSEQVSTFSYYCYTSQWATNGGQIRTVSGSSAHGVYGLRASGYNPTELPDAVTMVNNMVQTARVYKQATTASYMTDSPATQAFNIWITGWQYIPPNNSEIEIDHSLYGGSISKYLISQVQRTNISVNGQVVLVLTLGTSGLGGTISSGLEKPLYDGQLVTLRVLEDIQFSGILNTSTRSITTALQYTPALNDIYDVTSYLTTQSTGEALPANNAILENNSVFNYFELNTDYNHITVVDPTDGSKTQGSKVGDNKIAVIPVSTQSIISQINTGTWVMGWNGRVHRVTGYTPEQYVATGIAVSITGTAPAIRATGNLITLSSTSGIIAGAPVRFTSVTHAPTLTATNSSGNTLTLSSATGLVPGETIIFSAVGGGGTVSATTSGTNYVTVNSTSALVSGQPISFSGIAIGNLSAGNYFVKTVISPTQLTISSTYGGADKVLTTDTGSMAFAAGSTMGGILPSTTYYINSIAGNDITVSTSFGGSPVSVTSSGGNWSSITGTIFGGIVSGTTYYIKSIELGSKVTISSTYGGSTFAVSDGAGTWTTSIGTSPAGTTVVVNSVVGTITAGQVITGTGFVSGQTVASSPVISGSYTLIELSALPTSTPTGSITFGASTNAYISIDPNPVYNNSAAGVTVSAVSFVSSVTGSTLLSTGVPVTLVTWNIPYAYMSNGVATRTLPVVDSVLQKTGSEVPGYNGSFQTAAIVDSSIITVGTTTGIVVGMTLTTGYLGTATATAATTNLITVSSTTGMTLNAPITFTLTYNNGLSTGASFGGLAPGNYYIKSISGSQITVSDTVGGSAITLTTATGNLGFQLSYTDANTIVPANCIVQSITDTTNFVVSPATWLQPNTPIIATVPTTVASLTILRGGDGYNQANPPTITFSGGGDINTVVHAIATATVNQYGTVTKITIISPGQGYTSTPTVTISAPTSGVTATASAVMSSAATYTGSVVSNDPNTALTSAFTTAPGLSTTATSTYNGTGVTGANSTITNGTAATLVNGIISGATLTFTSSSGGTVAVGMVLNGGTVLAGTYIVSGSGTTWLVSQRQNASVTTATPVILTVVSVSSGTIKVGGVVTGGTVAANTYVTGQLTATNAATATTTATGTSGATTITVASTTSIITTLFVSGTSIPPNTYVTAINGSVLTLSNAITGNISSGTVNFYAAGAAGTYSVSKLQTQGNFTATSTHNLIAIGSTYRVYEKQVITFSGTAFGNVAAISAATATFSSGNTSTTSLVVNGITGTIAVGQIITGTGFNGTQTVLNVVLSGTTATVTLNTVPNGTPSGILTFSNYTYYVAVSVNGANGPTVAISTTAGGAHVTLTTATGSLSAYSPRIGGYTPTTVSSAAKSGTGPYTVTLTLASSIRVINGAMYTISGNSNALYNGIWAASTATGDSSTLALVFPYDPGTYGSGTTTVLSSPTTSFTSSQLGISKPFDNFTQDTIKLGYPAGTTGQITTRISTTRATSHDFLDIGTGGYNTTNYPSVVYGAPAIAASADNQVVEETVGRVFFVSTDQDGIFRVGKFFEVNQATGNVTLGQSIALNNLNGLGFKNGITVTSFTNDATFASPKSTAVPTESAVANYIDYRLGLTSSGSQVTTSSILGPGFLPLNGALAMSGNLNMNGSNIINLVMPTIANNTDVTNKGYVDTQVASKDALSKLNDVTISSAANGNFLVYDSAAAKWKNIAMNAAPGDVSITFTAGSPGTIATSLLAGKVFNSQVNANAAIAQSKLYMSLSGTSSSAGTTITVSTTNSLTVGSIYVIASLGTTTTQSNWNTIAGTTGLTYAVGSVITAAVTSGTGDGTVYSYAAVQATSGVASHDSTIFTSTAGWISLKDSTSTSDGIALSKLRFMASGYLLGNRSGSASAPTTISPANVITDGGGLFTSAFSGAGALTQSVASYTFVANISGTALTYVSGTVPTVGSTVSGSGIPAGTTIASGTSPNFVLSASSTTGTGVVVTGVASGAAISYSVTPISASNAADSLVKSSNDKSVDVGSLKVNSYATLSITGTTLYITTPNANAGVYAITSSGTTAGNTTTTTYGTFDTSNGTLKASTLTTGATSNNLGFTGTLVPTANSVIDLATNSNTLKVNTITTGSAGLPGTITGVWTLGGASTLQATYADLAEYYEGDQEYEPGTVLVFGGDKEVTATTTINDTRSAGVVTTNPAYVMNEGQTGIKVCIALAGRVPVKVVGRVKKGDMLTTSATAGYAVKALTPTLGAIIGKALEDKDYGEAGVIQVAVGRV